MPLIQHYPNLGRHPYSQHNLISKNIIGRTQHQISKLRQCLKLPDCSKRVIVLLHTKDLQKGTLHSILKQAGIDKKSL